MTCPYNDQIKAWRQETAALDDTIQSLARELRELTTEVNRTSKMLSGHQYRIECLEAPPQRTQLRDLWNEDEFARMVKDGEHATFYGLRVADMDRDELLAVVGRCAVRMLERGVLL